MSELAKRNDDGRRAESRTEAFLLDRFWVLKLSVDLDGAVFVVQPATRSADSLHQHTTTHSFSVVQSRSYRDGAEVEVAGSFVELPDRKPQRQFFVSIHAVDSFGVASDYFFSAEEVQSIFRRKVNPAGQEVFVFSITDERNYSQFRRKNREKESMISKALADVDLQKNQTYLNQVCEMPGSGSIRPLMIQVAENQWQMRFRDVLFEFERNENSIIYVSKSDSSGKKVIAHLLADSPLDDYEFDPLNEVWVRRCQ